jgi:GTPase SAR1 family protein
LQCLDKESYNAIKQWVADARNLQGDNIKIMLVGNKIDLAEKRYFKAQSYIINRQVTTEDGQALAKELKLPFIETSSKDGTNVNELFKNLAATLPGLEGAEICNNADGNSLYIKHFYIYSNWPTSDSTYKDGRQKRMLLEFLINHIDNNCVH